jgi:hypothetical protein
VQLIFFNSCNFLSGLICFVTNATDLPVMSLSAALQLLAVAEQQHLSSYLSLKMWLHYK